MGLIPEENQGLPQTTINLNRLKENIRIRFRETLKNIGLS